MRTVISRNEDAMRLLAQSGQPNSGQTNITSAEHFGSSPVLDSTMNAHRRTWPDELPLSQPEPDILRLWESFRFVRMGWLTAAEAVTYVDL